MNGEGEGAEAGIGADVARRPLAPDMLLARHQGEHVAASPVGVDGLAAQPPRHLAHVAHAGGEQAEVRTAEAHRIAQRLAFGGHDVGPHGARRPQRAEGDDLRDHDDQQRALGVRGFCQIREVGEIAEQVGILDHDAGGVGVNAGCQVLAAWRLRWGAVEREALKTGQRRRGVAVMRVQVAGDHRLRAARDPVGHHDRLGGGGGAVIHRGVGHFHAGQQADLGLELEQVLQGALGDFGLVGGVRGEKLAALDQIVHGCGDMMPIGAGAAEKGPGAGRAVLRRQSG